MTLEEAVERLKNSEVVAFPTETVYGLGADAWNPEAVEKIFTLKGRPSDNPLIVHIAEPEEVDEFASEVSEAAEKLMKTCWPGPLTLIFKKKATVLDAVTAGLPTVALRIPDHPVARELIRQAGPLAAPSANLSGRPSPTRADHVRHDFGSSVPLLDGGSTMVGLESTVLDVSSSPFTLLRPGKYTLQELSERSGTTVVMGDSDSDEIDSDKDESRAGDPAGRSENFESAHRSGRSSEKPRSPGIKYTHYKPLAEVLWYNPDDPPDQEKTLLITHTTEIGEFCHYRHFDHDFEALARDLYDLFRSADLLQLKTIAVEPLPGEQTHPLIVALKNRIGKAIG